MSAYSQYRTFAGVEIPSAQGLESTQNGHSRPPSRTSVIGSQSGRSMAAISWASVVNYSFLDRVLYCRRRGLAASFAWKAFSSARRASCSRLTIRSSMGGRPHHKAVDAPFRQALAKGFGFPCACRGTNLQKMKLSPFA